MGMAGTCKEKTLDLHATVLWTYSISTISGIKESAKNFQCIENDEKKTSSYCLFMLDTRATNHVFY